MSSFYYLEKIKQTANNEVKNESTIEGSVRDEHFNEEIGGENGRNDGDSNGNGSVIVNDDIPNTIASKEEVEQ